MKIVVNCRFLSQKVTGVQRFALELSKQLTLLDIDVEFIGPRDTNEDKINNRNIKKIGRLKGHLWEKVELPLYLLSTGSPILINFCNTAPFFYKNQIVAIHDMAVFQDQEWFSKKFKLLYQLAFKHYASFSKKIITVSEFSKKEIIKYLSTDASDVIVIYNGIEHFKYLAEEGASNKCDNIKGINLNEKFFLCVGSVEPRKNLNIVIESFQSIELDGVKLVIVGGKDKLFKFLDLKSNISEKFHDKVVFTGYLTDFELISLYSSATAFIFPSVYEGFGIPPLEAMSLGCPSIVSNSTSLPEVCGDAAIYFDTNDVRDLSKKLEEISKCTQEQKGEIISKGILQSEKYSWKKSALDLLDLIYSLN